MSFICARCKASSIPRIPATPINLETRKVEYRNVNRTLDEDGVMGSVVKVSKGTEIVRQVFVCPACADEFPKEMRG